MVCLQLLDVREKYVLRRVSISRDRKVQRQQKFVQLGIKMANTAEKTGLEITHCI